MIQGALCVLSATPPLLLCHGTIGCMQDVLNRLEEVQDAIERFNPPDNAVAYVTRELLKTLDRAHEMLKALADDGHTVDSNGNAADQIK
jgi:hypothetical protein